MQNNILLVGCGKMGGALLKGLVSKGHKHILVIEKKSEGADLATGYGVDVISQICDIPGSFAIHTVIFAVKPQNLFDILPEFSSERFKDALFVSVAAGKELFFYEKILGENAAIIRAMPNLPAIIGQGITVLCANENINEEYKKRGEGIFKSVGEIFWIDKEEMMHAVTAISGSGPAYVFYFMECLINSGIELGLPEDLALLLAQQTINGSVQLAKESEKTAEELKKQVVSPGGTTAAALEILEPGFHDIITNAIKAAYDRSKELGN